MANRFRYTKNSCSKWTRSYQQSPPELWRTSFCQWIDHKCSHQRWNNEPTGKFCFYLIIKWTNPSPNEITYVQVPNFFVWKRFTLLVRFYCRIFPSINSLTRPQPPHNFTNRLLKFDHFFFSSRFCLFLFLSFSLSHNLLSFSLFLSLEMEKKKNLCECAAIFSSSRSRSTLSFLVWKFVFKSALSRQRLRFEQQTDGYHQRRLRINETAVTLFGGMGEIHPCVQWIATRWSGTFDLKFSIYPKRSFQIEFNFRWHYWGPMRQKTLFWELLEDLCIYEIFSYLGTTPSCPDNRLDLEVNNGYLIVF